MLAEGRGMDSCIWRLVVVLDHYVSKTAVPAYAAHRSVEGLMVCVRGVLVQALCGPGTTRQSGTT